MDHPAYGGRQSAIMQDYDLATDKDGDLPSKPEKSERALMKVMRRCQKPIALFIDDGHDLALQEGTCDNTPQAISLL
jgi:type II secretory pathway predicted ATPase ExeA